MKAYVERRKVVIGKFAKGKEVVPGPNVFDRLVEEDAAAIHPFLADSGG